MAVTAGALIAVGGIWFFIGWWLHYLANHGVDTVVDWGPAPATRKEARSRDSKPTELQRKQFAVFDRSRWIAALVVAAGVGLVVIAAMR